MKFQVLSDLHLEFPKARAEFKFQRAPNIDALILAGDIHAHLGIFTLREELKAFDDVPIYYVPGNHEYYNTNLLEARSEARQVWDHVRETPKLQSRWPNLLYMDDASYWHQETLVLGGTLWTDCNKGDWFAKKSLMSGMTDFAGAITFGLDQHYAHKRFHPDDAAALFLGTIRYFDDELFTNPDSPAVVITHHLPHPSCVHPKYKHSPLNPGFVSDLSCFLDLNANIKLWVHGHTHDSVDVSVNGTRIVCNPRGYPGWINPNFDPVFTVTV